jgi:hypothetical protein
MPSASAGGAAAPKPGGGSLVLAIPSAGPEVLAERGIKKLSKRCPAPCIAGSNVDGEPYSCARSAAPPRKRDEGCCCRCIS